MDINTPSGSKSKSLVKEVGQFVAIPHSFLLHEPKFSRNAMLVFLAIQYWTNNEKGYAFPGYTKIMKMVGVNRNQVAAGLSELELNGWLIRERRFGTSSKYYLKIPRPQASHRISAVVPQKDDSSLVSGQLSSHIGTLSRVSDLD